MEGIIERAPKVISMHSKFQGAMTDPTEIASRYQIQRPRGSEVPSGYYKAWDNVSGRVVVVKRVRFKDIPREVGEIHARFRHEVHISERLNHPNVVALLDSGEDAEGVYLVIESFGGATLGSIIGAGPLSPDRTASIGAQVAEALDHVHRRGVIHRNINPSNIVVAPSDRAKIIDFGIAIEAGGRHPAESGNRFLGTPSYLSPEQAKGETLDGRTDIFSLGSVLYEMVCGAQPFKSATINDLILKIISGEPPPLISLGSGIPPEMARIISKALAKEPTQRYQSGRELAAELRAEFGSGPVDSASIH